MNHGWYESIRNFYHMTGNQLSQAMSQPICDIQNCELWSEFHLVDWFTGEINRPRPRSK